mmetsp:Transcript_31134/g.70356  ORF Transcript_31134/g.70356 Transcript_31134/m.70356 type:complete len:240 (-) Transcript_31134:423-1142(-)
MRHQPALATARNTGPLPRVLSTLDSVGGEPTVYATGVNHPLMPSSHAHAPPPPRGPTPPAVATPHCPSVSPSPISPPSLAPLQPHLVPHPASPVSPAGGGGDITLEDQLPLGIQGRRVASFEHQFECRFGPLRYPKGGDYPLLRSLHRLAPQLEAHREFDGPPRLHRTLRGSNGEPAPRHVVRYSLHAKLEAARLRGPLAAAAAAAALVAALDVADGDDGGTDPILARNQLNLERRDRE